MFRNAHRIFAHTRAVSRSAVAPPKPSMLLASSTSRRASGQVLSGAVLLSCVLGGAYWYSGSGSGSSGVPLMELQRLKDVASEGDIAVESPVKILDLDAANRKLRHEAVNYSFPSGQVHVVRVASNSPVEDEWALELRSGLGGAMALYAAVYDGHAGWATSRVLKDALVGHVSAALARLSRASDDAASDDAAIDDAAIDAAIMDAFVRLDTRIMDQARDAARDARDDAAARALHALAPAMAGSCALLAVYDAASSTLRTALAGDSRAVLGSWSPDTGRYSAAALTKDQTGFNQDEVARLEAEHPGETGDVIDAKSGRLLGMAVTRAFGDHRWKWPAEAIASTQGRFLGYPSRGSAYKTPPYMTARPEVTTRRVEAHDFVILASDGLWDVMSNQDAVACVERWLAARRERRPEKFDEGSTPPTSLVVGIDGYGSWKATPDTFVIEDLDSAAVCLAKNALGGRRRALFCGVMTSGAPLSRYVRDDLTVQVIFFRDPDAPGKVSEEAGSLKPELAEKRSTASLRAEA